MKFSRRMKSHEETSEAIEEAPQEEAVINAIDDGLEIDLAAFESVKAADEVEGKISERQPSRKKRLMLACVLLAAIVGVIVALSVTLTNTNKDEDEIDPASFSEKEATSSPTAAPSPAPAPASAIFNLLTPHTPEEVLLDSSTPQGQAFIQLEEEFSDPVDEFRVIQRYALMALYLSTSPDGWNNRNGWIDFNEDECNWFGISTCRALGGGNKAVSHIRLSNNLLGSIPSEFCLLGDTLEQLDMGSNSLTGSIPECFADFTSLIGLKLDENNLSGQVPDELSSLNDLTLLHLQNNDLIGEISSDLCNLRDTQGGVLEEILVDCEEVSCTCCGCV